jgi:hypothetical protein
LGSADPQCRTEKAVTRTPLMAYWSYSLLVVWFVQGSVKVFHVKNRIMDEIITHKRCL